MNLKVNNALEEKVLQIVILAAIYFLILSHPVVFDYVDKVLKSVGLKLGDTGLTVVHSVVFTIIFFYSVKYVVKNI